MDWEEVAAADEYENKDPEDACAFTDVGENNEVAEKAEAMHIAEAFDAAAESGAWGAAEVEVVLQSTQETDEHEALANVDFMHETGQLQPAHVADPPLGPLGMQAVTIHYINDYINKLPDITVKNLAV